MTTWHSTFEKMTDAVLEHGNPTAATRALGGINERTAREKWARWTKQHRAVNIASSSALIPTALAEPADPAEIVALKRKIDRLETSERDLKAQLKSGLKRENLFDDVKDLAAPLLDQYPIEAVKPSIKLNLPKRATPVEMVIYLSDWHVGEVIRPEEVEGRNEYGLDMAARRVEHIGIVLAEWLDNYSRMHPVSRITFVGLGDLVNNAGSLHSDQSTDYARVLVQALDASLLVRQLIEPFAGIRNMQIRWVSTAGGNHGRSTRKMPSGPSAAQTSWDQVCYEHLAAQLQGYGNIEWIMGRNYAQRFDVAGNTVWVAHGHALKGGGGALGIPAYGARRSSTSAIMASIIEAIETGLVEDVVQYVRIGHFHQRLEMTTPTGDFKIVPSIKGAGPWEMEVLGAISNPECLFEVFHPEFGIIGSHTIDCSKPMGSGYKTGALTSTTPVALLA